MALWSPKLPKKPAEAMGEADTVGSVVTPDGPLSEVSTLVGFVERVDQTVIRGWVYDKRDANTPVAVEAVASNGKRVVALANGFRADVRDAGHGDGRCGFDLDVGSLGLTTETIIVRSVGGRHLITSEPITLNLDPRGAVLMAKLPARFTTSMRIAAEAVERAHMEIALGHGRSD